MGIAIAKELYQRGADVTLVMGPIQPEFSANGINIIKVTTAEEMYNACNECFDQTRYCSYVSSCCRLYSGKHRQKKKLKRTEDKLVS